eukprot:867404_1
MEESKADTDETKDRVGAEEYCENIQNCRHLKQLYKKMIEYNDYNTSNHKHDVHNTINMVEFIDDYLHLIYQHDNDEDFDFIVCELDGHNCDIMNCKMHRRNYRNRSNDKDDDHQHMDVNEAVYVDIMDTAHCYFVHCYDVGKRLTRSEKQLTHCANDEKHDTLNTFEQQLTSKELVKIKSILQEKQDTFETLNGEVINTKFNQISDACTHTNGKFSFGNQFFYGYEGEFQDPDAMIEVHPIYNSLKDELVSNKLSVITINQFINQCKKAQIHFRSRYRKTHFPKLSIECILAMMIYCCFDPLQAAFSKTYRNQNHDEHQQFYHLGKHMKISIQQFGTEMNEGAITDFFHGINQKLSFPNYITDVSIHCPLSTTSSFPVALMFATLSSNGLIVQFSDSKKAWSGVSISPKYASVSWLSRYGNEKEFLFLQNAERFKIVNIIDYDSGYEYNVVLQALRFLDQILYSYYDTDTFISLIDNPYTIN